MTTQEKLALAERTLQLIYDRTNEGKDAPSLLYDIRMDADAYFRIINHEPVQ